MNLQQKIKSLPSTPGVYLMKDSYGTILYVGKSKELKKRVQSYFRSSTVHAPKIKRLVTHVSDLDHIVTDTEFEAFLLEWQLIQEYKPHYNRKMKSPQGFIYLTIPKNREYRSLKITTQPMNSEKFHCFGPYTSRKTVVRAIEGFKSIFRFQCSHPNNKKSRCLNYSLGLCNGLCLGGAALEAYDRMLDMLIAHLEHQDNGLVELVNNKMEEAAEKLEFEEAARYRNYRNILNSLFYKEEVIHFTEENHKLAIVEEIDEETGKVFFIQRTDVVYAEKFAFGDGMESLKVKISEHLSTPSTEPPFQAVTKFEIDKAQIIYSYLNSGNCRYVIIDDSWLDEENERMLLEQLNGLLPEKNA
ncbi:GIY-YIG nuclease family protein [Bacillus tianshenii]|uniref:GIY-YIG nuclease family protein n=1 Tax=Sutcliffiella tianshenii TaxID=1463404 RepID=UPI001CD74CAA|nr:GIY-YIG nuclease family protein [Bacillus tianshenii]MCA1318523.1 GIY-YIG nuclease family protein [Bacillus tianshenii]